MIKMTKFVINLPKIIKKAKNIQKIILTVIKIIHKLQIKKFAERNDKMVILRFVSHCTHFFFFHLNNLSCIFINP